MKFLKHILLGALSVSHIFLLIGSCANSLNQQNYLECKLKARSAQAYSYKSQSFEECRAPAVYRTAED